ncbi:MAG: alpha-ribazole phosphatase [bacterium]|nr:alpha-ribazole phosphatase [bacterium]
MITLLRHGEIKGGKRFRGSTDDPLTANGFDQMRSATKYPFTCDLVISSPLIRCASFASELSHKTSVPLLIEPRLKEMHFGDWEGRTSNQVYDDTPKALEQFWSDPQKYPPPKGERLQDFCARVLKAFARLIEHHRDQHLLLVTHGGVIRILLCHLQNIPLTKILELEVGYGARFIFAQKDKDHFVLLEQL